MIAPPRTQWDIMKANLVPSFDAYIMDSVASLDGREVAIWLTVEANWLGVHLSFTIEITVPAR
jgi:hypothetical protein